MVRKSDSQNNKTFLVTGAGRGIGLEFVRQLTEAGHTVLATARVPAKATELKRLAKKHRERLCVVPLDVADDGSVAALAEHLHFVSIDVLINNAGVLLDETTPFEAMDSQVVLDTLNVNAVGPLRVTRAVLPMLRSSKNPVVLNISSGAGSIAGTNGRNAWALAYRVSKAALNMANKALAGLLAADRITSVTVCPGWVRTDMGGPKASLAPTESVRAILASASRLTLRDAGRFMDRHGQDIPW